MNSIEFIRKHVKILFLRGIVF